MIRALLLLAAFALSPSVESGGPIRFPTVLALEHRISGETTVAVPHGDHDYYGEVDVDVTIGLDGRVIEARVGSDGNRAKLEIAPALAAARAFKFRPFSYRGKPVVAMATVSIRYVAGGAGGWRDPNADLPPIDYARLSITLTRSSCYGSCPDYQVTIDGAGNVVFTTSEASPDEVSELHRDNAPYRGVLVPGTHRTTIDRATLDKLIEQFRAVRFFGLRAEYSAAVTDNPSYVVTFESGGKRWQVVDYVGEQAGMPVEVSALQDAIDEAAGTARWVHGNAQTVPALLAGGFDSRGEEARRMALMSALWEDGHVAADLIAAGLPLEPPVAFRRDTMPLGSALLWSAVQQGRPRLFAMLAERGWLKRTPRAALDDLFASGSGGCDPGIARAMVAAGANPNARSVSERETALISLLDSYNCRDRTARDAQLVALLKLGADVDALDDEGRSAIFHVEDPDQLERLLAAGARIDIKDKDGNSAAFASWTDVIVLRLLDAGADPRGAHTLDRGGFLEGDRRKSLRQIAREYDMPAVLAWLDARGIP
jgi:hypothetical protein